MSFLQRQLEDPLRLTRLKRWAIIVLAVMAAAEILLPLLAYLLKLLFDAMNLPAWAEIVDVHPPHFWFEWIPAWGSLYGLISCVVIIVVSKFLGKTWLMRREDYYDS